MMHTQQHLQTTIYTYSVEINSLPVLHIILGHTQH